MRGFKKSDVVNFGMDVKLKIEFDSSLCNIDKLENMLDKELYYYNCNMSKNNDIVVMFDIPDYLKAVAKCSKTLDKLCTYRRNDIFHTIVWWDKLVN